MICMQCSPCEHCCSLVLRKPKSHKQYSHSMSSKILIVWINIILILTLSVNSFNARHFTQNRRIRQVDIGPFKFGPEHTKLPKEMIYGDLRSCWKDINIHNWWRVWTWAKKKSIKNWGWAASTRNMYIVRENPYMLGKGKLCAGLVGAKSSHIQILWNNCTKDKDYSHIWHTHSVQIPKNRLGQHEMNLPWWPLGTYAHLELTTSATL